MGDDDPAVDAMTNGVTAGPVVPWFAVDRPDLVDRFDLATRKRLVLVVAPAGYGKSVLSAQWHAANPVRRVVWTAVRPTDDAVRFGRRLVRSLDDLVPGAEPRAAGHLGLDESRLGEDFLEALLDELETAAPVTVVIEDLDALSGPLVLDDLGRLVDRAPEGVGFVFASRDDRLPGVPGLRLRDEVAEIRQDALALTSAEAAEVIHRVSGRHLTSAQTEALHARTEGWAAGIQLAALGLRDAADPDGFVAAFAGDDRHVADYLSGEVLARQPPEITEFLLRTSVLDRLSGSLCDALTDRDDGQRILEHLEHRSLFVRPLDGHRRRFTYHPLFRDLLRYELRATRPSEERGLLERAAAWHLERGESPKAADYHLQASDWAAVIALAKAEGGRYFARGEPSTVLRWLSQVPPAVLLADPDAVLAVVTLHTMCGSTLVAQDLLDRLEVVAELDARQAAVGLVNRACWVNYHLGPDDGAAAAEAALARLEQVPDDAEPVLGLTPAALRSLAVLSLGLSAALRGEFDAARRRFSAVESLPGQAVWRLHALGERAWADACSGRLRSALAVGHRALAAADEAGLNGHPATAIAHLALARARRERGETTAVDHLETGLTAARLNRRGRVLSLEWGERAHLALIDGRVADGLAAIARSHVEGGMPPAPVVRARRTALESRLHLVGGHSERALAVLDAYDGIPLSDLAAAAAAVAASTRDVPLLRKVLGDWPGLDGAEPASRWAQGLWTAVLHDLEGDRRAALGRLREVVDEAEAEAAVRLFLDAGGDVLRLVRALYHDRPTPFLRSLVEDLPPVAHATASDLVEQLSARELVVLRYLPSRLSNAEIAARLYVSVNTLKTHLKSIYRKLAVANRGEAIARAESLGLL